MKFWAILLKNMQVAGSRIEIIGQQLARYLKSIHHKGPSINDVSFEKEGGGCQKWHFEAIFRAKTEATGGGRGV